MAEPDLDWLSTIIKCFNEQFGNIPWVDAERIHTVIVVEIRGRVGADRPGSNVYLSSDKQYARIENDKALMRMMTSVMKDRTELFKRFMKYDGFRR